MKKSSLFLTVGLGFLIISIVLRYTYLPEETLSDLGILAGALSTASFVWGTIKYAKIKGRYNWAMLTALFMPLALIMFSIVFLLKPKDVPIVNKSTYSFSIKDGLLMVALIVSLFGFVQFTISYDIYNFGINSYDSMFKLWTAFIMLPIIVAISIWALISNRRQVLTISYWILLTSFFIWLFIVQSRSDIVEICKTMRNVSYIYITSYVVIHLVIHGFFYLKSKERKVLTAEGLFHWRYMLLFSAFFYSIYELLLRIISG